MTITTILLAVFGALLVATYALWFLGAYRLVAGFGGLLIRTFTLGRVHIATDAREHSDGDLWCDAPRAFSWTFSSPLLACTDMDINSSNEDEANGRPRRGKGGG